MRTYCSYPIFSHFCVYVHGSLTQITSCYPQVANCGSCLYEKPWQKQRCRWDNVQVAPTQGFDCAMLYRASGRPGVLLAVQLLRWWRGEAEQPEPAGTFDTEGFSVTGFSKWKLSQQSSGQRLFDTGEGLSLISAWFLVGYFVFLPFS